MKEMEKLYFVTAGMPLKTKGSYNEAFDILSEMDLDGMEMEFVHGVRISDENKAIVKNKSKEKNFAITAHAPFYINLNSPESEKTEASIQRIIETVDVASQVNAYSITFHAAFYMGKDKETVYSAVKNAMEKICENTKGAKVWIRPETTGKATQWGDLEEIIRLSNEFETVLPCVDFSHLHARTAGEYNTYDEFCKIFDNIGSKIGQYALDNFHAHLAGIEYTQKGERKHLNLDESDMNYKSLLKAMKEFDIKGVLVCESPNIEDDALLIKQYYNSL
ncbi:TIM barrel protein [bacterium]|nr:TIM barrel protein [bacterium]